MNIILIDCDFGVTDDHHVEIISPPKNAGMIPLARLLAERRYDRRPDLIVQREYLGQRVFLSDLADFPCPKLFWAIDTHLNMFWHRYYARLFDAVLTPHKSLFDALPPEWAPANVRMFTVPGYVRKWKPFGQRTHFASFVGVRDKERRLRNALADMLRDRYGISMCGMPFEEMLDLYEDSQVIPNESICQEINFRLFEGASCGCCVLTPDIGKDLTDNFDPDAECLTYGNVLELDELLTFLRRRPDIGERIGRNAQKRILGCHLPRHRFLEILETAQTLSPSVASARTAERDLLLARIEWARSDPKRAILIPLLADKLQRCGQDTEVRAMLLRLVLELGKERETVYRLVEDLLACDPHQDDTRTHVDINLLCAVAAFRLDDEKLFANAWERQFGPAQMPHDRSMRAAFLHWARFLADTGRLCQPGFQFDPERHCPQTAMELLLMAEPPKSERDGWHEWLGCLADIGMRSPLRGHYHAYCTQLAQEEPEDWRTILRSGIAAFHAYELDGGIVTLEKAITLSNKVGALPELLGQLDRNGMTLEQIQESWQRKLVSLDRSNGSQI